MSQSANETDSTASAKNSAEPSQTNIRRRDRAVAVFPGAFIYGSHDIGRSSND